MGVGGMALMVVMAGVGSGLCVGTQRMVSESAFGGRETGSESATVAILVLLA